MPVPISLTNIYKVLTVTSPASITAGFTVAVPSPLRGVITGVYLAPLDGALIGGATVLLALTIANVASASVSCPPVAAGVASGGREMLNLTPNVNEGELIKATLPAGLTNATVGVLTIVIRAR